MSKITRRTLLAGASIGLISSRGVGTSTPRREGRIAGAGLRPLCAAGNGDARGRRDGGGSHQCARRREVARRRQTQAGRSRFRRHHGESEKCGTAHGRAGTRPGGGERGLSEFVHARGHGGHGAGQSAGSHPLLLRSDHGARLQIRISDLRDRRVTGETSPAADREAGGSIFGQEAQDGCHHHRQHRRVGRLGKVDARGPARRERAAIDRRRNLYAAANRRHLAGSEGSLGET